MRLVIPSVRYADMLAVVLPAWAGFVPPHFTVVVTSPEDRATIQIAQTAGVRFLVTDAWRRGGVFNKAAAINEAFAFDGGPEDGELCISADADVVPFGRLDTEPARYLPDAIYGCPRFHCPDQRTLQGHAVGTIPLERLGLLSKGSDAGPVYGWRAIDSEANGRKSLGFFQLWRARPGLRYTEFPTAGGYDGAFRKQFAIREVVLGFYMLHLGPRSKANWSGRVVPAWR